MTRNEVVEEIKNIVLNYNVNSSIDIDSNIIYIEFGNNNKDSSLNMVSIS